MAKTKVKGSPQYNLKVVAHRPEVIWGKRISLVAAAVVIGVSGYWAGYRNGGVDLADTEAKLSDITIQANQAEQLVTVLEQRVSQFDTQIEINTHVVNQLRGELVDLQKQNEELQHNTDFFKSLLQPGADRLALRFDGLKLQFDGQQYQYSVNVRQLAVDHKLLKGTATVELRGYQGEQFVTLPAASLGDADSKGLRFRYYQEITGNVELPQGFRPTEIRVFADVGKADQELIQPWPLNNVAAVE